MVNLLLVCHRHGHGIACLWPAQLFQSNREKKRKRKRKMQLACENIIPNGAG